MNMKMSAEHTYGLPITAIAAYAMLLIGFGTQAFAASHFGPTRPDAENPAASGLPFPGSDGTTIADGLEVAAHPASAGQPAPNPPSEIGPVTPASKVPEAKSSAWMTADRILIILAFLGGIVIVGFVAAKMIRKKRKPDAH